MEQARGFGLETITGLVEEHDFGSRRFDLVIICQTVDHLLDVGGTLRRVRELLSPTGLLFVDIVDFRAAYLRELVGRGRDQDRSPVLPDRTTMTGVSAEPGLPGPSHRLRRGPSAHLVRLPAVDYRERGTRLRCGRGDAPRSATGAEHAAMSGGDLRHAAPIVLGVVPARGGSKGVPGKNVRPLAGRPLLTYPPRLQSRPESAIGSS